MKKWFIKMLSMVMCLVLGMACLGMVACGDEGDDDDDGTTKVLKVAVYDGGFGQEFLEDLKAKFEEKHKNDQFADGKVGVKVSIYASKDIQTITLADTYQAWEHDIYFTDDAIRINDMWQKGQLLDVSDIVTEKLDGEEVSIDEKLSDQYKQWYKINGKYGALPWTESGTGFFYDRTMFWEEKLFLAEGCDGTAEGIRFIESTDSVLSVGPDGKSGTDDDGLPQTYDEFFALLDKMTNNSIIPMMWSGMLQGYFSNGAYSLYMDHEGASAIKDGKDINTYINARFDFTGETDYIDGWNGNEPIIKTKTISDYRDAFSAFRQPGLYYTLDFIDRLISNKNYYDETQSFGPSNDHIATQRKFYYSNKLDPVGFLLEGTWWYNEAKKARQDYKDKYPNEAEREYAMLYFPKVSTEYSSPMTLVDLSGGSAAFIKANINEEIKDLAKEFYQMAFTNEALANFTKKSCTTAPYDYTISNAELAEMPSYGQQIYKMHTTANYAVTMRQNKIILANTSIVRVDSTGVFHSGLYGYTPTNMIREIRADKDSGVTMKDVFESICNPNKHDATYKPYHNQEWWDTLLSQLGL